MPARLPLTRWWAAALAVPLLVASAVRLALTSGHLAHPGAAAAYRAYLIAVPMLIGLAWWRRRPESRYGPLLIVLGLAAVPLAMQSSDVPLVAAIGVLSEVVYYLLFVVLCVAFTGGRPAGLADRVLIAVFAAGAALFYVPAFLLAPQLPSPSAPLVVCAGACPANPFDVATLPGLAEAAATVAASLVLVATTGLGALFVQRLRRATRPQRREVAAVAATTFPFFPVLAALCVARVASAPLPTLEALGWVFTVAGMVFALGFLAALLRAELFAGAALRRLLTELSARAAPSRWRDAVALALDDPSVRVAYWDPARRAFRRPGGGTLERPVPGDGRRWTPVTHGDEPVAAMTTDAALADHPELLQAAAQATLIAVRTGHLEGELRDSRVRLLEAGNAERRRIQRDLHDSAQQRLVALRVHLELAGEGIDAQPVTRDALSGFGDEVEEAIDDLRRVAHGLFPPMLEDYGAVEAVRSAARHTAMPVRVVDEGIGRQSGAVESTVYFCCLEALQNAAKHAGPRASATVRLGAGESTVWFTVEDDGRGFVAALARGTGLTNLRDRVAAMGGSLDVESAPGRGTRLAGRLPDRPAVAEDRGAAA
jgi:signal transduction histidine kinase